MIRKEGKEGKVERRGRVEVVLQESAAIWRQNLHKSSLSSDFFGAGTEFYFFFFFFFPSLHILEVSSICWSIGFYDSRLNFSKVTSTWGILVFFFL